MMELFFKYPSLQMLEQLPRVLDSLEPIETPSSFWRKRRLNKVLKEYDAMSREEAREKLELWLYYDYAVAIKELESGQYCGFRGYWLRNDTWHCANALMLEHQMKTQSDRGSILYGPIIFKLRSGLFKVTDCTPDDENHSLEAMLPFMNEIKENIQHGEWINPFDEVLRLLFGKAEDLDNPRGPFDGTPRGSSCPAGSSCGKN